MTAEDDKLMKIQMAKMQAEAEIGTVVMQWFERFEAETGVAPQGINVHMRMAPDEHGLVRAVVGSVDLIIDMREAARASRGN